MLCFCGLQESSCYLLAFTVLLRSQGGRCLLWVLFSLWMPSAVWGLNPCCCFLKTPYGEEKSLLSVDCSFWFLFWMMNRKIALFPVGGFSVWVVELFYANTPKMVY